ncbi:hypothetical protein H4582DRAFT_2055233 [Lactarius indigo]|nr:hypothetical protein H4582DRAFT_2055233 [Lactarius indigo]
MSVVQTCQGGGARIEPTQALIVLALPERVHFLSQPPGCGIETDVRRASLKLRDQNLPAARLRPHAIPIRLLSRRFVRPNPVLQGISAENTLQDSKDEDAWKLLEHTFSGGEASQNTLKFESVTFGIIGRDSAVKLLLGGGDRGDRGQNLRNSWHLTNTLAGDTGLGCQDRSCAKLDASTKPQPPRATIGHEVLKDKRLVTGTNAHGDIGISEKTYYSSAKKTTWILEAVHCAPCHPSMLSNSGVGTALEHNNRSKGQTRLVSFFRTKGVDEGMTKVHGCEETAACKNADGEEWCLLHIADREAHRDHPFFPEDGSARYCCPSPSYHQQKKTVVVVHTARNGGATSKHASCI